MPPEYVRDQVISKEFDIFSLGVIILKIMVGHMDYLVINGMGSTEVIKHVTILLLFIIIIILMPFLCFVIKGTQ